MFGFVQLWSFEQCARVSVDGYLCSSPWWSLPSVMSAFVKSVVAGALAAALPVMLMTVPISLMLLGGSTDLGWQLVWVFIVLIPPIITLPLVLVGFVTIVLPAGFVLRRFKRESTASYVVVGAFGGFLTAFLVPLLKHTSEPLWLNCLGTLGGATAAYRWWCLTRPQARTDSDGDMPVW